MVIFNEKLILLLKKISLNHKELIPYQKVYNLEKVSKVVDTNNYTKSLKVNANKVMFCWKFFESKGMILALLFNCHLKQKTESTVCMFSHLEGFMSN
jgi:hypothetical protein